MDKPKKYLQPLDPDLRNVFDALPEALKEAVSERMAIIEFDGGFDRATAERLAMDELLRQWQRPPE